MNIFESIKMALNSIRANKMRAFLTMLGIIIGISSVITIVSLGNGGQDAIMGEFQKLGAASVNIRVDSARAQSTEFITLQDIKQIKEKVPTVLYVSPSVSSSGIAVANEKSKRVSMTGGSPDLAYVNNTEMVYGRFFNEREYEEGSPVVIIDENSAEDMFGYTDVVGQTMQIGQGSISKKVTIIGVEKGIDNPFGRRGNNNMPIRIKLPITFLENIVSNEIRISSITVMADTKENSEAAGIGALNILESRHNNRGQDIYSAESALQMLDQINSVITIFTSFIGAVAAISLLVGGIGVMNIIRALGLGADDYMTKPFSPSEPMARVKSHISRYERLVGVKDMKKGIMEIRGLIIDETSRRVYVNNKEVILTTKEFDLLLFLASNPNRVFTKEEPFENLFHVLGVLRGFRVLIF